MYKNLTGMNNVLVKLQEVTCRHSRKWDNYQKYPLTITVDQFRKLGMQKSKREQVFQNIIDVTNEPHTSLYSKYILIRAAMNSRRQFSLDHVYTMDSPNDWFFLHIHENQREFLRGHRIHEDTASEKFAVTLDQYGPRLTELEDKDDLIIKDPCITPDRYRENDKTDIKEIDLRRHSKTITRIIVKNSHHLKS
ncbi:hypothetical protein SNEBB_009046 [Seison nebaliae]|nr:hypothetical protein SNEBB_009046 [Seison nebaliae]